MFIFHLAISPLQAYPNKIWYPNIIGVAMGGGSHPDDLLNFIHPAHSIIQTYHI